MWNSEGYAASHGPSGHKLVEPHFFCTSSSVGGGGPFSSCNASHLQEKSGPTHRPLGRARRRIPVLGRQEPSHGGLRALHVDFLPTSGIKHAKLV